MDAEPGQRNHDLRRLWLPPRARGEVVEQRTVGFIELFYDLVYVVLIARTAHNLAGHLSWSAVGEFALVFSLIWIAWLNGTAYHDSHGREDIRSRTYIFVQMLLIALLASRVRRLDGDRVAAPYRPALEARLDRLGSDMDTHLPWDRTWVGQLVDGEYLWEADAFRISASRNCLRIACPVAASCGPWLGDSIGLSSARCGSLFLWPGRP